MSDSTQPNPEAVEAVAESAVERVEPDGPTSVPVSSADAQVFGALPDPSGPVGIKPPAPSGGANIDASSRDGKVSSKAAEQPNYEPVFDIDVADLLACEPSKLDGLLAVVSPESAQKCSEEISTAVTELREEMVKMERIRTALIKPASRSRREFPIYVLQRQSRERDARARDERNRAIEQLRAAAQAIESDAKVTS